MAAATARRKCEWQWRLSFFVLSAGTPHFLFINRTKEGRRKERGSFALKNYFLTNLDQFTTGDTSRPYYRSTHRSVTLQTQSCPASLFILIILVSFNATVTLWLTLAECPPDIKQQQKRIRAPLGQNCFGHQVDMIWSKEEVPMDDRSK